MKLHRGQKLQTCSSPQCFNAGITEFSTSQCLILGFTFPIKVYVIFHSQIKLMSSALRTSTYFLALLDFTTPRSAWQIQNKDFSPNHSVSMGYKWYRQGEGRVTDQRTQGQNPGWAALLFVIFVPWSTWADLILSYQSIWNQKGEKYRRIPESKTVKSAWYKRVWRNMKTSALINEQKKEALCFQHSLAVRWALK